MIRSNTIYYIRHTIYVILLVLLSATSIHAQTDYSHWNYIHTPPAGVTEFHVHPNGSSTSDGSEATPWDLPTALKGGTATVTVQPGDIILLHGGTYRGRFTSTLKGTAAQPIYVVAVPGERVTLDGYDTAVTTNADIFRASSTYTIYWGFEIMSSDPVRATTTTGSNPPDIIRGGGITTLGGWNAVSDRFINLVIHDASGGYGNWTPALDTEIYGNVIYNNGWSAPDRGHGHGIYCQNAAGTKKIHHNIVFNQFSYNLHCYTEGGSITGIDVQENVFLHNNNIIGGYKSPDRITYSRNFVGGLQQLATNGRGINGVVQGNYFFGTVDVGPWTYWENIDFTDNTIMPAGTFKFTRFTTNLVNHDINRNKYRKPDGSAVLSGLSIQQLRDQYGLEMEGAYEADADGVWILPNKYEPGRAHIIIHNPQSKDTIDVDISSLGLSAGDQVTLRNGLNYYDDIEQITYDGSPISVQMTSRVAAKRVGLPDQVPTSSFPKFGIFVLESDFTPGVEPTIPVVPGDTDGDADVDIFDYNVVISNFGNTGTLGLSEGDLDADGDVDIFDYNLVISNFGT